MSILPFDDRDGFIWMDGKIRRWRDAKVHVLTHGLHYGSCVFEGERAYDGVIFKSLDHSKRFLQSAELLGFAIPYTISEIETAKAKVLYLNGGGDQYVRPVAWRGSEMMALGAQQTSIHVAIASWDWPFMFDPASKMMGIRLDLAEFRRPDPKCAPAHSKAAGLYMISTISKHRAEDKGYADAMMLDWQGRIAECTGANILFVQDGAIHTPIADCFLDGITRRTVIELARRQKIKVIERRILPDELEQFEECLICGTGAEVTPVSQIGPQKFTPANISRRLIEGYAAEVRTKSGNLEQRLWNPTD
jgi:branched-chain amino acid aminotransferase